MAQEDKYLLLNYLCMALPYKVKTLYVEFEMEIRGIDSVSQTVDVIEWEKHRFSAVPIEEIKPYLRQMSSMTEEEKEEYKKLRWTKLEHYTVFWLLENHFDFMGLIPKNLAIEVTEDNNPYEI